MCSLLCFAVFVLGGFTVACGLGDLFQLLYCYLVVVVGVCVFICFDFAFWVL